MTVFAVIGSTALWLLYGWLASAIIAGLLAWRKGYSETAGIASGLLLFALGPIIWLIVPAKPESRWKVEGVFPKRRGGEPTSSEAASARPAADQTAPEK